MNISNLYKHCNNIEKNTPLIVYDDQMEKIFEGTLQQLICKHEELLYRNISDFEIVAKAVDVVEIYLE